MFIGKMYKIKKTIKTMHSQGFLTWADKLREKYPDAQIYLVGGIVRDALLGKKASQDMDFVVRNVPLQHLQDFLNQLGWVEKLGKNFGVLKFKPQEFIDNKTIAAFDIALPRKELSLSPGSYKDFSIESDPKISIEEDLSRRDFTVNAMAVKLGKKIELVDPFHGLQDLKAKKIKAVGQAEERLAEDYTRLLRALRFACQLNFKLEKNTSQVIKKLVGFLSVQNKQGEYLAPREVVAKELLKSINADYLRAIHLYDKLGIFKELMPEVLSMKNCPQPEQYHSEGDVWQHTLLALKFLKSQKFKRFSKKLDKIIPDSIYELQKKQDQIKINKIQSDIELILALFWHDLGKPATIEHPVDDSKDRIRFNNHDQIGASMAREICQRLKLSAPEKYGIDADRVAWLIERHMVLIQGSPENFRATTIEKIFLNPNLPGKNLIKLAFADAAATIPKTGKLEKDLVGGLLQRIRLIKHNLKAKKRYFQLPKTLLDGNEIMQVTGFSPGRRVGQVKERLREEELVGRVKTKKEAREFILKKFVK